MGRCGAALGADEPCSLGGASQAEPPDHLHCQHCVGALFRILPYGVRV